MVFFLVLALVLMPQSLDLFSPTILRLEQSPKHIKLIIESPSFCEIAVIGPKRGRRPCPRKKIFEFRSLNPNSNNGETSAAVSSLIQIPVRLKKSKNDYAGFFEPRRGILVLPFVPDPADVSFKENWHKIRPRVVFILNFGSFKKDLFFWKESPWNPQLFLPEHRDRPQKKWDQFLYRSDWSQKIIFPLND